MSRKAATRVDLSPGALKYLLTEPHFRWFYNGGNDANVALWGEELIAVGLAYLEGDYISLTKAGKAFLALHGIKEY